MPRSPLVTNIWTGRLKQCWNCGVAERDIVTDKISSTSLEREGYMALRNTMLRDGDTLIIKSLDRLSRNNPDGTGGCAKKCL